MDSTSPLVSALDTWLDRGCDDLWAVSTRQEVSASAPFDALLIKEQAIDLGSMTTVVLVKSVVDGMDHAVTDQNMATGICAGDGRYTGLCGSVVISDALIAPPGRLCPRCDQQMHPTSRQHRGGSRRRGCHRRNGPFYRLIQVVFTRQGAARHTASIPQEFERSLER